MDIGHLFDNIASKYDFFNHATSFGIDYFWRKKAVKRMSTRNGKILDVAIGTGDLALRLLKQGCAMQIEGLDLSQEMMKRGAQKMQAAGYAEKVSFTQGSAFDMPYDNECFDAVTCAYGVRNFTQLQLGLQEMNRVLKQNGELMILEFSLPQNRLIALLYDFYFNHIMTFIGRCLTKDKSAFAYFYQSVQNFASPEQMKGILEQTGFENIKIEKMTFGISTIFIANKKKLVYIEKNE